MVDIIIPAYNCSKTLSRTLASIVAQTESKKCIVTVVDDCSTEDLKPIIKTFSSMIKIQYLRTSENLKSPGLARQWGINHTNARYIMFLDADDVLASQAVEVVNREMMHTNADVLVGHFYHQENGVFNIAEETNSTWLHGKVYKRSFLEQYNITFSEGINEDGPFNTQCFALAKNIYYFPQPIYYWLEYKDSLTRSNKYSFCESACIFVKNLVRAYENILKYKNEEEIYYKIGRHLAVFYNKYCTMLEEERQNSEEIDLFLDTIRDFVIDLKLNERPYIFTLAMKRGFLNRMVKTDKSHAYNLPTFLFMIKWQVDFCFADIQLLEVE